MRLVLAAALTWVQLTLAAQPVFVSTIDFFGLRNTPEHTVRQQLNFNEGDSIDMFRRSIAETRKRLLNIPGIRNVDIATVCCDEKSGGWIIYVGIDEKKGRLEIDQKFYTGADTLPSGILSTYLAFESLLQEAVLKGEATEDDSNGHSLLLYAPARAIQEKFVGLANGNTKLLKKILRTSSRARHRAIAALVLPYGDDKKGIVEDLLYAIGDPDETVRNNSARALGIFARFATLNDSSGIVIPIDPFLSLLKSVTWSDRNKATMVLEALTSGKKNEQLLSVLRKNVLPEIVEMSRWRNPGHAVFPLIILGRIAGNSEEQVFAKLYDPERQRFVDELVRKIGSTTR